MKSKKPYKKKKVRLGRGPGSTKGKTCGKGHKGQKARSGAKARIFAEGGQNSFIRRLPKRGFVHATKKIYSLVNVGDLEKIGKPEITPQDCFESGLVHKLRFGLKVLGDGVVIKALIVHAHAFSEGAKEKIEKAGGKAIVIKTPQESEKQ